MRYIAVLSSIFRMQLFLGLSINAGQPLWQTLAGLGLIGLGIWLFRWVVVAEGTSKVLAFLIPLLGGNHLFRRMGVGGLLLTLVGLSLPLLMSVFGGMLAINGFMNRVVIDETSISIHQGLEPVKRQVWDDFEAAGSVTQGTVFYFKEAKHYKVNFVLSKEQLGEANAKLLLDWLEQRFPGRVYR